MFPASTVPEALVTLSEDFVAVVKVACPSIYFEKEERKARIAIVIDSGGTPIGI